VYVLGVTKDECGASEWYAHNGILGNNVPRLSDAKSTLDLYRAFHRAAKAGLVRSAHDCSDGGLGVALAETAMAGRLGIRADLDKVPAPGVTEARRLLWSETLGRLVVTVRPGDATAFEKAMSGSVYARVGEVTASTTVEFAQGGKPVLSASVDDCVKAWKKPFGA